MARFGSVKVGHVLSGRGMRRLLEGVLPESDVYLVKPNWYSPAPGGFTDAAALEALLSALPGKAVVVEGYSNDRQDGSTTYRVDGEKVDWKWLLRNPDWGWLRGEALEEMRRQDLWFRDSLGISEVLDRFGAEYLSVTEEVLAGRTADPQRVKERVESRFPAVRHGKLYGYMPSRLAEHSGAPLVSLGHVKGCGGDYPSLALKNMFGLIPDPLRSWWHGPDNKELDRSIVDIAKVYAAHFPVVGVCEAITSYTVRDPEGRVKVPWGSYRVEEGARFAACGPSIVELDAVMCGLIRVDPEKVGYVREAEPVFGAYRRDAAHAAAACSVEWFPGI